MNRLLVAVLALSLSACAALPQTGYIETEHTSHPFAGPPFGPRNEEDSLTTANVGAEWKRGSAYVDAGFGIKLYDGGFYGPPLTFNLRAGVRFDLRRVQP